MKITMLAVGTKGDVYPLVALGEGLQLAGHKVGVATFSEFEPLVRSMGLRFSLIDADPRKFMTSEMGHASVEGGGNPFRSIKQLSLLIREAILQSGKDCLRACEGTEAVIYSPAGGYVATSIAEKLRVQSVGAFLQPVHRTGVFPSYVSPNARNLGIVLNRLSYFVSDAAYWVPFRSAVNQFREQLGCPSIPLWVNEFRRIKRCGNVVYGFSSSVVPKPSDWGSQVEITGYWYPERLADWQPSTDLVEFLAAGPPPVCIGFGSMSTTRPERTTKLVLEALMSTRQRGLLLKGWGGLKDIDLPEEVFSIDEAPHEWLFPQMAAVVHHGGSGTTAAGLRAGTPTIIIPHFMDQAFWGRRVAALGAGPEPIPRKQLSSARLANAISAAVTDESIASNASCLGKKLRSEDGVGRAVEVMNKLLIN